MPWTQALSVPRATTCFVSIKAFVMHFSEGEERSVQAEIDARLLGALAAGAMGD